MPTAGKSISNSHMNLEMVFSALETASFLNELLGRVSLVSTIGTILVGTSSPSKHSENYRFVEAKKEITHHKKSYVDAKWRAMIAYAVGSRCLRCLMYTNSMEDVVPTLVDSFRSIRRFNLPTFLKFCIITLLFNRMQKLPTNAVSIGNA